MEKIILIHSYIENKLSELGVELSPLKAMKLPYIAFGFYGAQNNGEHLFENKIEAWQYGPTIPDLF